MANNLCVCVIRNMSKFWADIDKLERDLCSRKASGARIINQRIKVEWRCTYNHTHTSSPGSTVNVILWILDSASLQRSLDEAKPLSRAWPGCPLTTILSSLPRLHPKQVEIQQMDSETTSIICNIISVPVAHPIQCYIKTLHITSLIPQTANHHTISSLPSVDPSERFSRWMRKKAIFSQDDLDLGIRVKKFVIVSGIPHHRCLCLKLGGGLGKAPVSPVRSIFFWKLKKRMVRFRITLPHFFLLPSPFHV
jgi:hypothetical protein